MNESVIEPDWRAVAARNAASGERPQQRSQLHAFCLWRGGGDGDGGGGIRDVGDCRVRDGADVMRVGRTSLKLYILERYIYSNLLLDICCPWPSALHNFSF